MPQGGSGGSAGSGAGASGGSTGCELLQLAAGEVGPRGTRVLHDFGSPAYPNGLGFVGSYFYFHGKATVSEDHLYRAALDTGAVEDRGKTPSYTLS